MKTCTGHSSSTCTASLALAAALVATGCTEQAWPTEPSEVPAKADARMPLSSTITDLLALEVGPVAIAHRGMGANLGEDASRPIENTIAAVRQAYNAGASVVEVDLQVTADGEIVAWHDDYLDDYTCLNTLTRAQLEERAPQIPSFAAVLQAARAYNTKAPARLTGLLTVDLKPSSPLCDPTDAREASFVEAVVSTIRQLEATELIYFNSMSPVLLGIARAQAPEIPRQLTVLMLQLLPAQQVEAALGLPVTLIQKNMDYGLQWAEIGSVYRLPGYSSPQQALQTALATGAQIISYDLLLLGYLEHTQAGSGAQLIQATKALGIHVFAGDVSDAAEWQFGAALSIDALYANDVPLAVSLQPPLQ